jgi:hypothetical protein
LNIKIFSKNISVRVLVGTPTVTNMPGTSTGGFLNGRRLGWESNPGYVLAEYFYIQIHPPLNKAREVRAAFKSLAFV